MRFGSLSEVGDCRRSTPLVSRYGFNTHDRQGYLAPFSPLRRGLESLVCLHHFAHRGNDFLSEADENVD
jgi:hypothetical protein